jgi:dihydrolipoamide dehydrogenase
MTDRTDIAILGGGPGGYVAALRAAQLGARVILVEESKVGGTCLNVGCMPTKALLRSAEVYESLRHADRYGLRVEGQVTPDWPLIQNRKQKVVQQLVKGVELLLQKANVQLIQGRGRLTSSGTLEVAASGGSQSIEAKQIVVATGSRPVRLPLPGMGLPGVIDSTGALSLEAIPRRMVIIGGGVLGVEFAEVFNAFGAEVTVVEMLDRLLPLMDADLGQAMERSLHRRRIKVWVESRVTQVEAVEGGLRATVVTPKGEKTVEADQVLVAVGRRPNVEDMGLEAAGVRIEKPGIPVDDHMQTNVPGLYAVGDVNGRSQLAHVAMISGEIAVENALGHSATLDLRSTPSCVYTSPEVASVGLTEIQAQQKGYEVRVGRFPLTANGKALTYDPPGRDGFVKVVSEARFGEVLGLHIFAPHACDLIHEGGLALTLEATLDELIHTVHAHPTLGEAVREAALECRGQALHIPH